MRFRWVKQASRRGCISAVVTRKMLKGLDIEEALELALPSFSVNPESISQLERKRLLKEAEKELKRIEESRQSCTGFGRLGMKDMGKGFAHN